MDAGDATAILPYELIHAVFDHVTLSDVIRASHVSQRWRALAFQHPTYWHSVEVHEAEDAPLRPSILQRAAAQLSRCSSYPVQVAITRHFPLGQGEDLEFLRALMGNMHRIGKLSIQTDYFAMETAYTTMLSSSGNARTCGTRALPPSVSSLRELTLVNVKIPTRCAEFQTVTDLCYLMDDRSILSLDWLSEAFPNLQRLSLHGVDFGPSEPAGRTVTWVGSLCHLALDATAFAKIACVPGVPKINSIHIQDPRVGDVSVLVSHFQEGQLQVDLQEWNSSRQPMTITESPSGLRRVMDFVDYVWLPDVPTLPAVSARVTELSLPMDNWDEMFTAFSHIPSLVRLAVGLDEDSDEFPNKVLVVAPALQVLALTSDEGYTMLADDACQVVRRVKTTSPPHLDLRGVRICGWNDDLAELCSNGSDLDLVLDERQCEFAACTAHYHRSHALMF